jgi:diguanylate cyclase (GGDEF)-like protein/PAS domain S-box-containing protein
MDQSFNGIFELDTEGNFIFANTNGAEILKYSVAELSQKTIEQIIAFTTPHFFQSIISNNNLEQKQFFETNLDLIAKDGSIIYAACHFKPILRNGKIASIVMSFNDISNYRANLNAAQELALYDPLTKLPNRLLYLDRVKQALMASKRYQSYVALLFIDLDKFKPINDNYGHLIGDLLLTKIAARLQKCLRKGHDTVARLGGDEFVIILGNLNSDKTTATLEVEKIANKIIKSIRSPLKITLPSTAKDQAISLKCSASIGICLFQNIPESPEITPEYLINSADKAMYVAKKMGGNQIHFFSPGS